MLITMTKYINMTSHIVKFRAGVIRVCKNGHTHDQKNVTHAIKNFIRVCNFFQSDCRE